MALRINQKSQNQKMFFEIIENYDELENDKTKTPVSIDKSSNNGDEVLLD